MPEVGANCPNESLPMSSPFDSGKGRSKISGDFTDIISRRESATSQQHGDALMSHHSNCSRPRLRRIVLIHEHDAPLAEKGHHAGPISQERIHVVHDPQ